MDADILVQGGGGGGVLYKYIQYTIFFMVYISNTHFKYNILYLNPPNL